MLSVRNIRFRFGEYHHHLHGHHPFTDRSVAFFEKHRERSYDDEKSPIYWMDFGNAQTTGQVLIGNVKSKIPQPSSTEYLPIPKMNVITEEVPYSTIREKDSGPSCSLTEALQNRISSSIPCWHKSDATSCGACSGKEERSTGEPISILTHYG